MERFETRIGRIMELTKTDNNIVDEFYWHSIEHEVNKINQEIRHEIENRLEFALRHLVTPPIKGKITRGKIRWRGIQMSHIIVDNGDLFNTGITEDGKLKEPTFIGRTIEMQFSWKVNLTQRGKEIPLTFGAAGEKEYFEWLTEK